jgi:hypothetical protein
MIIVDPGHAVVKLPGADSSIPAAEMPRLAASVSGRLM